MSRTDVIFQAKAVSVGSYKNLKIGDLVTGYYVKSRGRHYILQEYNDNGYDERWESSEWIEVDKESLVLWNKDFLPEQ